MIELFAGLAFLFAVLGESPENTSAEPFLMPSKWEAMKNGYRSVASEVLKRQADGALTLSPMVSEQARIVSSGKPGQRWLNCLVYDALENSILAERLNTQ